MFYGEEFLGVDGGISFGVERIIYLHGAGAEREPAKILVADEEGEGFKVPLEYLDLTLHFNSNYFFSDIVMKGE